jgi:hypothetical protein
VPLLCAADAIGASVLHGGWAGGGWFHDNDSVGVCGSMTANQNQRSAVPLRWLDRWCVVPWWWTGSTVCDSTTAAQWEDVCVPW